MGVDVGMGAPAADDAGRATAVAEAGRRRRRAGTEGSRRRGSRMRSHGFDDGPACIAPLPSDPLPLHLLPSPPLPSSPSVGFRVRSRGFVVSLCAWAVFLPPRVELPSEVCRFRTGRGLGGMFMATLGGSEEDAGVRLSLERSIYDACKRSPEGSDFLVSAFVQALHSYRRSSVLTPFPSAIFTTEEDGFQDKDFAGVAAAVQTFPPLQDVLSSWTCDQFSPVGDEIQKAGSTTSDPCCLFTVDKMSLSALKLLDWILRFRHHVELVQDPESGLSGLFPPASSPWASFRKELASEACTIPDYVMKIRENEEDSWRRRASGFDAVKAESGSFYAFHGTSAENLHSILRCGLLNMSNSQLQRNGCMFGEGVYLSTDPGVAYSFCKAGTGWTHSFCGSRVRYLLVCEVAGRHALRTEAATSMSGSLREAASSSSVPNTYVLVKNSDLVKIRYVLVYTEPSRVQITLRSSSFGPPDILPEVSGTHHVAPGRHVPKLGFANAFRRVDWCKSFIVLYIALLIGVGLLKHNTGRYGRGSLVQHFLAVYQ